MRVTFHHSIKWATVVVLLARVLLHMVFRASIQDLIQYLGQFGPKYVRKCLTNLETNMQTPSAM